MNQLVPYFREADPKARIALVGGAVATIVVLFLLFRMATAPSYETLLTGVDPADAGKITQALDEQGISYELTNGGTGLAVLPDDAARARIALAEQGLPGKGQPGFELFDEQKMGTSDFQQQVNYQRALEGEIARTVGQVDGVSGAKVQLVMPDDQLFAEDRKPATAAVLLNGDASALDSGAVRGIAQLVASSVEGLELDKVTITDSTGSLLWPTEANGDAGSLTKLAAEQRYNQMLEAQLTGLLAGTVGADKAKVQVSSTLNLDKVKERKLTYDRDEGIPLKQQTEEEQLESEGGGGARGAAGTASNVPGYAGGAGGAGGDSNYERNTENTEYGVDKTVRDTEFAPGAVEKQNVAVVLDDSVPPQVAAEVEQAIAGAAGIDPGRGDTITVNRVAFAEPPAPVEPSPVNDYLGYAKWAALGLASLLFLFFVTRHLRKRESENLEPVWLREITAPQPLAALESEAATAALQAGRQRNDVRRRAEEIAAREPAKVAQQLRAWMQEEA